MSAEPVFLIVSRERGGTAWTALRIAMAASLAAAPGDLQ